MFSPMLVILAFAACGEDGPRSGDLVFKWTINARSCAEHPDVAAVHVKVLDANGLEVEGSGPYDCDFGEGGGLIFEGLRSGRYDYALTAADSDGVALYAASSSLWVEGRRTVEENLIPLGQKVDVTFVWSFRGIDEAPLLCEEAGVDGIEFDFGPLVGVLTPAKPFDVCRSDGFQVSLYPRTYPLRIRAFIGERAWYRGDYSAPIQAREPGGSAGGEVIGVTLVPSSGAATFKLDLGGEGDARARCAARGVDRLRISLTDWSGQAWPDFSDACDTYLDGFRYEWLPADEGWDSEYRGYFGTWSVRITAEARDGTPLFTAEQPGVTIWAGAPEQFVTLIPPPPAP